MEIKEGVVIPIQNIYSREQIDKIYGFGVLVGLDQATNSGVVFLEGDRIKSYRCTLEANKDLGSEINELTKFIFDKPTPTFIAHEIPTGRYYNSIVKASKILGGIITEASRNNTGVIGYTAPAIKKIATNKGNANKAMMLEAGRKYADFASDDEADAFFLLMKLVEDLLKQN